MNKQLCNRLLISSNFSNIFRMSNIGWSKDFFPSIKTFDWWKCSLLFLPVVFYLYFWKKIFCVSFFDIIFKWYTRVYSFCENLYQLTDLNIGLVPALIFTPVNCVWILISFVAVVLYYLELTKLQLEYKVSYQLLLEVLFCRFANDKIC